MSEFEAAELTAEYLGVTADFMSNYATHLTIYLTLVFAYCAGMYIAGKKLDTLQVIIATTLFVVAAEFQILTMALWVDASQAVVAELSGLEPSFGALLSTEGGQVIGLIIWNMGILASLVFMWRVRNPQIK